MRERINFEEPFNEYDARSWKNFWLMLKVTITIAVGLFILLIIIDFIFRYSPFINIGSFIILDTVIIVFFSTFTSYYYIRAKKRRRIKILKENGLIIIEIGHERYKANNVLFDDNPLHERLIVPYHNSDDDCRSIKYDIGGISRETKLILMKYLPKK